MPKKFVLIAEDDAFYARVYRTKLATLGHEIKIVDNGVGVLHAALLKTPDLIVLDLMMPIKDGFETLIDIRTSLTLKDIPVIVVSHLDQAEDISKVEKWGISAYYKKHELQLHEFSSIVSKHLI